MDRELQSRWAAEATWWNVGKVIAAFLFLICFCRAMLALVMLFGGPTFHSFPELYSAPAHAAIYYGVWSVVLVMTFRCLESRR